MKKIQGKLFAGGRGFDPTTISMEIVSLQLAYYTILGVCVLAVDLLFGLKPTLGQIFVPSCFDLSLSYSLCTLTANIMAMIPYVIAQAFIIEKANKVLDFTLTTFIIHFVLVIVYNGKLIWHFDWWVTHALLIIVTVLFSEFVLMRIEQQEIKLSFDSDGITKIVEQGKQVIKEVSSKPPKKPYSKKSEFSSINSDSIKS